MAPRGARRDGGVGWLELQGAAPDELVSRRVRVSYLEHEGAPPVPYLGVVTYAEKSRFYVVFDGFHEAEGAWVNDGDEWAWAEEAGAAPEAPGAWEPGGIAPTIDKIFSLRAEGGREEMLVKWKGMAHIHCQWVPREELELEPGNRQRVIRWIKARGSEAAQVENTWDLDGVEGGGGGDDELGYNPDFHQVERIIARRPSPDDLPPQHLIKWRGLPYAAATWENSRALIYEQTALKAFEAREVPPTAKELKVATSSSRPPRTAFRKLERSPAFRNGHELRPYQLEGLNWLLFSWYTRRSVMLADEMGLGKTIQSVSTLAHIVQHESIRGPFLIVAPLSTLNHWKREFDQWTDLNAVVYHGTAESRDMIRRYEWQWDELIASAMARTQGDSGDGKSLSLAASANASQKIFKFHALITSYEVIKQDLERLKKVPWRYLVVDEAHRLKNRDSALANDLRSLRIEHCHLLSGTPLQNNTTELWALLSFLDPSLFPTLQGFVDDFGTLTDADQVERLNAKIRPYLLRRQKNDVEKSLAPLEETIVWVEMTLFQKKTYKAILEGNREILVGGVVGAAMPSLVNLQMELRKCCNHPYLIKGVEAGAAVPSAADGAEGESSTNGSAALTAMLAASGKCVLLDKLLPKLRREGHRVLIFSQMVRMLDLISEYLLERRYSHERLDGTIRGDLRQAAIDRFCRPNSDTFIFLLSTRAGGLGINLTAADTCILLDSDWNPQNDVQAMARSHRIGQTRRVKVFRLCTRNTYEAEMLERANRKLGLERAMNADRANDGLAAAEGGKASKSNGPPQERAEIDAMLRRGAHDIFLNEADDADFKRFSEADIDEILQSSSTKITYGDENADSSGSVFSKAAFIADDSAIDVDDPEFWTKILPEMDQKDPSLDDYIMKRRATKQVKRFGMADDDAYYEDEEAFGGRRPKIAGFSKTARGREDDDVRRAARRALSHVWSKTERMGCERALLSFGFGRWARVKEAAGGGTRLRTEAEIAAFGLAFVCLCSGVQIGAVGGEGGAAPAGAACGAATQSTAAREDVAAAHEVLREIGCRVPSLSQAQVTELEPLVSAGGAEYAERVRKLGASMLQRLLALKRLSDAIERHASPLVSFRAPPIHGGVGRHEAVSWTPRDDALLLLGIYKHGFRAYEELRDDPELPFSCRLGYAALPPPLPQPPTAPTFVATDDADSMATSAPPAAPFDALDVLPLLTAPQSAAVDAARIAAALSAERPPGLELEDPERESQLPFLPEKEFRERARALMDALGDSERLSKEMLGRQAVWEEEWQLEIQGGSTAGESKAAATFSSFRASSEGWDAWYSCMDREDAS